MTDGLVLIGAILLVAVVLMVVGLLRGQKPWSAQQTDATKDDAGYWWTLVIALDVFVNAFIPKWLLGNTVLGETISARCGRFATAQHTNWLARGIAWLLNALQIDHTQKAVAGSLARFRRGVELETQALGRDA
jgi:hypothetical protein